MSAASLTLAADILFYKKIIFDRAAPVEKSRLSSGL